jgi:SagB-type dehydrogenase family enzyme
MAVSPAEAGQAEDTTRQYHRLSSYAAGRHWTEPADDVRVRQDFIPMRPGRRPAPFKRYPDRLLEVPLPRRPSPAALTAAEALAGAGVPGRGGRTLDLDDVSAVLFEAAGVVRYRDLPRGGREHFRAASSAGNRHPIEVYLCARRIEGLDDGVWHYRADRHALTRVAPAPRGEAACLVLTGIPWRTCWKYAERGYRHLWWDCGTVAAQAVLAARSRAREARLVTAFVDEAIGRLVGADPRWERPLAILTLAEGAPATGSAGPAVRGDLGEGLEEFPLVAAAHQAGDLRTDAEAAAWAAAHRSPDASQASSIARPPSRGPSDAVLAADPSGAGEPTLDELIRRRGSARRFAPDGSVSRDTLARLVRAAGAPPPWDAGPGPTPRLLVHAVDGLPAGAYAWTGDGPRPLGPADRARSQALCLDQELARDAAFLLFFTLDEDRLARLDTRAYRTALLGAGYALGRLYLAAELLGVGCSGLTFIDELLPAALGGEAGAGLAVAVIGRTAYRRRDGGAPGAPTALAAARPPRPASGESVR